MPACSLTALYSARTRSSSASSSPGSRIFSRCGHSVLTWPNSDSIQAWSVGVPGRPKCWAMRDAGQELAGGVGAHLRAVVATSRAARAAPVGRHGRPVRGRRRPARPRSAAVARSSASSEQALASSAAVNATSTWVEVSSAETTVASHLRETTSRTATAARPARGEVGEVVAPDPVRLPLQPVRPRLRGTGSRAGCLAAQGLRRPAPAAPWTRTRAPAPAGSRGGPACGATGRSRPSPRTAPRSRRVPSPAGRAAAARPAPRRRAGPQRGASAQRAPAVGPGRAAGTPARVDQPRATAWSTRASRPALTGASTRGGTGPAVSPNAIFPRADAAPPPARSPWPAAARSPRALLQRRLLGALPGRPGTAPPARPARPAWRPGRSCTTVDRSTPTVGRLALGGLPGQHRHIDLVLLARREQPPSLASSLLNSLPNSTSKPASERVRHAHKWLGIFNRVRLINSNAKQEREKSLAVWGRLSGVPNEAVRAGVFGPGGSQHVEGCRRGGAVDAGTRPAARSADSCGDR